MSRHGTYDLKYGFIPDDDYQQETPNPSNGDRIRSMTDEEMADYLRYYSDKYARYDMDWLDWLKRECDQ